MKGPLTSALSTNSTTATAASPPVRLLPYHHTLGLLSTLRIFYGEDNDTKRVHVPVSLVVRFWELLTGVTRTTSLVTLFSLESHGSLGLTRYGADGSAEYWEEADCVEELAELFGTPGGNWSVIPRLTRLKKTRERSATLSSGLGGGGGDGADSETTDGRDDDDENSMIGDGTLGNMGDDTLGGDGDINGDGIGGGATRIIVNTASTELRRVKEMMDRLQSGGSGGVGAADGATEVFMLPQEANASRAEQQQERPLGSSANPEPVTGSDIPSELLARIDTLNLEGVFVVLNSRQYRDAVLAGELSTSIKSKVEFPELNSNAVGGGGGGGGGVAASAMALGMPLRHPTVAFAVACDDVLLHETAVRAYRTQLRGTGDNWALGPQDNYFYLHIEQHVIAGKYQGPFEMSLAWRLALLMNTHPSLFGTVYGDHRGGTASEVSGEQTAFLEPVSPSQPSSPFGGGFAGFANVAPQQQPLSCTTLDLSAQSQRHNTLVYYSALQQQPMSSSIGVPPALDPKAIRTSTNIGVATAAASPTSAAAAGDDLIPFFLKRSQLVQMAAGRAERSLLQATKRSANNHLHHGGSADHRSSSLARKSRAHTPSCSPPDNSIPGFASASVLSPGASAGLGESTSSRQVPAFNLSPKAGSDASSAHDAYSQEFKIGVEGVTNQNNNELSGVALTTTAVAPTHLNAEPFQKMLDAALEAMNSFPALVTLVLDEGPEADVASFVLRTCVVDMPDGQEAVVDALCSCFLQQMRLTAAARLLQSTSRLTLTSTWDAAARERCTRLVDAILNYLIAVDHRIDSMTREEGRGEEGDVAVTLRGILLSGHTIFFPRPYAQQTLLQLLKAARTAASVVGVIPYLQWLRVMHSVAICFCGSPLHQMIDFPPPSEEAEGNMLIEWLFHESVESISPALRWTASYVLHNRRAHEERSSFIEDLVYMYWIRCDSLDMVNGVVTRHCSTKHANDGCDVDFVLHMKEFVAALPSWETPAMCSSALEHIASSIRVTMIHTTSEWAVLPPKLKIDIRSGFPLDAWDDEYYSCGL